MKLNISGTELVVLENVETLDTHAVVLKVNLKSRPGFKRIRDVGERCSVNFSLMYQDNMLTVISNSSCPHSWEGFTLSFSHAKSPDSFLGPYTSRYGKYSKRGGSTLLSSKEVHPKYPGKTAALTWF